MAKLTNLTIWKRNFVKLVLQKKCMRIVRILRNLTFLTFLSAFSQKRNRYLDIGSIMARYHLDNDSMMMGTIIS